MPHVLPVRWRVVLPIVNFCLAVGLAFLAAGEYHSVQRFNPGAFYEGNYHYMPLAQAISLCLNAPSYATSMLVRGIEHWFRNVYWFPHDGGPEYYAAVPIFWWWIGRKLDKPLREPSRDPGNLVMSVLGIGASCWLIDVSVRNFIGMINVVQFTATTYGAGIAWGILLIAYFGNSMLGMIRRTPQLKDPK